MAMMRVVLAAIVVLVFILLGKNILRDPKNADKEKKQLAMPLNAVFFSFAFLYDPFFHCRYSVLYICVSFE